MSNTDGDRARGNELASACIVHRGEFVGSQGMRLRTARCGDAVGVRIEFEISQLILFDCVLQLQLVQSPSGTVAWLADSRQASWDISYLSRGRYELQWETEGLNLSPGQYQLGLSLVCSGGNIIEGQSAGENPSTLELQPPYLPAEPPPARNQRWKLSPLEPGRRLSWQRRGEDWFFKHFDHAVRVVINYMLDDSPLLGGRILDVGCGEGVTDLGIFLRKRPELLVGIDIEANFKELPRLMREYGIPEESLSDKLQFRQLDASSIPYPDSYFDLVISWGSLEHVAGGYFGVLEEIKRVLKDGGLFFVHPGLYYSNPGHHLGEFTTEPFAHLTKSREELKRIVFTTQPNLMDRGGLQYNREDFWRYYCELNKITVSEIEGELKHLGFEFKKVAVRTDDLITYNEQLQSYSIQDLTTREIYMSLINRKTR